MLFPGLGKIGAALVRSLPQLFESCASSMSLLIPGYIIGALSGIVLGVFVAMHPWLQRAVRPLIFALSPVPPSMLTPYLIAVLPTFYASSVAIIFLGVFWPYLVGTITGINLIDKKYLDNAIQGLRDMKEIVVEKVSEYLVTEPYGDVEQDEFLNGALRVRTLLSPEELLDRLHVLEQAADRKRIIHWGPRTLDLDILFYDNEIIDTVELHVPHIDMENRDFVLKPMVEIAPYLRHPVLNLTMEQLLKKLEGKTLAV